MLAHTHGIHTPDGLSQGLGDCKVFQVVHLLDQLMGIAIALCLQAQQFFNNFHRLKLEEIIDIGDIQVFANTFEIMIRQDQGLIIGTFEQLKALPLQGRHLRGLLIQGHRPGGENQIMAWVALNPLIPVIPAAHLDVSHGKTMNQFLIIIQHVLEQKLNRRIVNALETLLLVVTHLVPVFT